MLRIGPLEYLWSLGNQFDELAAELHVSAFGALVPAQVAAQPAPLFLELVPSLSEEVFGDEPVKAIVVVDQSHEPVPEDSRLADHRLLVAEAGQLQARRCERIGWVEAAQVNQRVLGSGNDPGHVVELQLGVNCVVDDAWKAVGGVHRTGAVRVEEIEGTPGQDGIVLKGGGSGVGGSSPNCEPCARSMMFSKSATRARIRSRSSVIGLVPVNCIASCRRTAVFWSTQRISVWEFLMARERPTVRHIRMPADRPDPWAGLRLLTEVVRPYGRWYAPINIATWSFLGGICVLIPATVLGVTTELGTLIGAMGFLSMLVGGVIFLALLSGIAWTTMYDAAVAARRAITSANARSLSNPEAAYETRLLRRQALERALFGTTPNGASGRRRPGLSPGLGILICFGILAALAVRQGLLVGPIRDFDRPPACGLSDALTRSGDCRWSGQAQVLAHAIERDPPGITYYHLALRLPDGSLTRADLGTQDIPQANKGSVMIAEMWRGKVTRVSGYGSNVWTADNPKQQQIDTWRWFGAIGVVTVLLALTVLYRYWVGLSRV